MVTCYLGVFGGDQFYFFLGRWKGNEFLSRLPLLKRGVAILQKNVAPENYQDPGIQLSPGLANSGAIYFRDERGFLPDWSISVRKNKGGLTGPRPENQRAPTGTNLTSRAW
jgi:hypothetical protein